MNRLMDLLAGHVRREAVAIHEAGHAIACVVLGLTLEWVTVTRSAVGLEIFRGQTSAHLDGADPTHRAVAHLAGPAASRFWRPDDWLPGQDRDFRMADEAIELAVGGITDLAAYAIRRASISERVRSMTDALIAHHWPEVERLATALLERDTLNGDEVLRLFERSLRERGGARFTGQLS